MSHVVAIAGATGRIAVARHLRGALLPLLEEGRIDDLVLVGRDQNRLEEISRAEGGLSISTDFAAVLGDSGIDVLLDATGPMAREGVAGAALASGKHVLMEKPAGLSSRSALALLRTARRQGRTAAMVQDKLFTAGFQALARALRREDLGHPLYVTGEFGYWVDDGLQPGGPSQRPSWNYQSSKGGSLSFDLFTHWSYLLELVGLPERVLATATIHVPRRMDEKGRAYTCDVPDTLDVEGVLEGGATFSVRSSWVVRPFVPFTLAVHGTRASIVAQPDSASEFRDSGAVMDPGRDLAEHAYEDEFLALWRQFLRSIDDMPGETTSLAGGCRAALLCEAIDESARTRAEVLVPRPKEVTEWI